MPLLECFRLAFKLPHSTSRSLDGLAEYIAELESTRVSNPPSQSHDTHVTSDWPGREEKKSRSQNTSKKSSVSVLFARINGSKDFVQDLTGMIGKLSGNQLLYLRIQ